MKSDIPDEFIFASGKEICVPHPFVREKVSLFDEDGPHEALSWRPGIRWEMTSQDGGDAFADAVGEQLLTVVSRHKPGKFPERIFYTRRWRDPDGKVFGKTKCRVTTVGAFKSLVRGYRHEFLMTAKIAA